MTKLRKINVRGYIFFHSELLGKNPYNDQSGTPIETCEELSYAWSEAAYNIRLSEKDGECATLSYNNFGS